MPILPLKSKPSQRKYLEAPENRVAEIFDKYRTPKRRSPHGTISSTSALLVVAYSPSKESPGKTLRQVRFDLEDVPALTGELERRVMPRVLFTDDAQAINELGDRKKIEQLALDQACQEVSSPERKIIQKENAILASFKRELSAAKIAYLQGQDEKVTAFKAQDLAGNFLNISKKNEGFSRAVVVRDRTLISNMKRALKRVVLQDDQLIFLTKRDKKGRSNLDRMREGLAPMGPDGRSVELHHLAQSDQGDLAELSRTAHSKAGHHQLHFEFEKSSIDRSAFRTFRQTYWKLRAQQIISKKQTVRLTGREDEFLQAQKASSDFKSAC